MKKTILTLAFLTLIAPACFSEITGTIMQKFPGGKPKEVIYVLDNKEKEMVRELFTENGGRETLGKIPDGRVRKVYENGTTEGEYNYLNNKITGSCRTYFENGALREEVTFKNEAKDGLALLYDESGQIREGINYVEGKISSLIKIYYEYGVLKEELLYIDGTKEGLKTAYSSEGIKKQEVTYRDGKKNGPVRTYYKKGKLHDETNYKDDKKDGLTIIYDEKGRIDEESNYKEGRQHGLSKIYFKNGVTEYVDTYSNGSKINTKKYDEKGKWILNQNFTENPVVDKEQAEQNLMATIEEYFEGTQRFNLLSGAKRDNILREQNYKLTGCTRPECVAEIGKIANVKYMAAGSIYKTGKEYTLSIRIVSVENSEVIVADVDKCYIESYLYDAIKNLVQSISEKKAFDLEARKNTLAIIDFDVKTE